MFSPLTSLRSLQIAEVQGLLTLNREIKALWMTGPLRRPGEDGGLPAEEAERKAETVSELVRKATKMIEDQETRRALAAEKSGAEGIGGVVKEEDLKLKIEDDGGGREGKKK